MYLKTLKERVEHDAYVVDTHLVAEAMLRRVAANRTNEIAVTRRGVRVRAAAPRSPRPRA
jgi:hypothetical protein